jgi:hypothetical protein
MDKLSGLAAAELPDDAVSTGNALVAAQAAVAQAELWQIRLGAHWLDLHAPVDLGEADDGAVGSGRTLPGTERYVAAGADGTPLVGEFACAEFAALQGMHPMAGMAQLRKVANLRHRHPRLWSRVQRGEVPGWKGLETARRIGLEELHLTKEQAEWIDERSYEWITTLPWSRYLELLDQLVIEADPRAAEQRRLEAETRQGVWTTQSNEHGLKTMVARAVGGDVTYLIAVVDRIAEILAAEGDTREIGQRRAVALGILAHPAHALALLAAHAVEPADTGADDEAAGPTGGPGGDATGGRTGDATGDVTGDASEGLNRDTAGDNGGPDRDLGLPVAHGAHGPAGDDDPAHGDPAPDDAESGGEATTGAYTSEGADDEPSLPSYLEVPEALGSALDLLHRPGVLDRLMPSAQLYVHVDETAWRTGVGSARVEGFGTITVQQARRWLGHRRVKVTEVIDLNADVAPVDGYAFPRRMREVLHLRNPRDAFPFGVNTTRNKDIDHPVPYRDPGSGGPPGQTGLHNAAPLARFHHRLKTHGSWELIQLGEGTYLWRSPHGFSWMVDASGSHAVPRAVAAWLARAGTEPLDSRHRDAG